MVLFEELKRTIPSEQKTFKMGGTYMDRFTDIRPAGITNLLSEVRMKHCLEHLKHPPTPEATKRIDAWVNPNVEERRIFHAQLNDEQLEIARKLQHGVVSKDRTRIKDVLQPKEPTDFEALLQNHQESIYDSVKKKPVGHVPKPNLPPSVDPLNTVFGLPYKKDGGAGPLINPPISRPELRRREAEDRKQYYMSHKHLIAGEQAHRRYEQPAFDPQKSFGITTHCDGRGIHVRRALNWSPPAEITPVTSQRQFDYNERFGHKLGRTRDPIADTMNVPPDHTFGVPGKRGELTVGQLLHGRVPRQLIGLPFDENEKSNATTTKCVNLNERVQQLMPVIHHALREAGYWRGAEIAAVLCNKAGGADVIPLKEARELYEYFSVPLDEELTEQLFDVIMVTAPEEMAKKAREDYEKCEIGEHSAQRMRQWEQYIPWAVDWRLMSAFLDWKRNCLQEMRLRECGCAEKKESKGDINEDSETVKRRLRQAVDANLLTHTLSSQDYVGTKNDLVQPESWKRLGKAPIQRNVAVPKVRGFLDKRNYGDEPNVASVVHPNIYSEYGLSQRDLLMLRNKEEMQQIMANSGLSANYNLQDKFETVWSRAMEIDKSLLQDKASADGSMASIHAFKLALFDVRGEELRASIDKEYAEMCCS